MARLMASASADGIVSRHRATATATNKDLRIGALSALYAAAMLVWRDKEAARAHLHGIGTWHEGPLSAPKVVVTAKGRKSLLQGY